MGVYGWDNERGKYYGSSFVHRLSMVNYNSIALSICMENVAAALAVTAYMAAMGLTTFENSCGRTVLQLITMGFLFFSSISSMPPMDGMASPCYPTGSFRMRPPQPVMKRAVLVMFLGRTRRNVTIEIFDRFSSIHNLLIP